MALVADRNDQTGEIDAAGWDGSLTGVSYERRLADCVGGLTVFLGLECRSRSRKSPRRPYNRPC